MNTEKENGMQMTFDLSTMEVFPEQTSGVLDSHARTSVSAESNWDGEALARLYFSQLQMLLNTSQKKINPHTYSLRMLKTYFTLIEGLILPSFSLNWMTSGMMRNGQFLTVKTLESHRTGKESILLDILEEEVDQKYFLSKEQMSKIMFL